MEVPDWVALDWPLQLCSGRGVIQDSGWVEVGVNKTPVSPALRHRKEGAHCQDTVRGSMASLQISQGHGLRNQTASRPAHSKSGGEVEVVACIVSASLTHPSRNSENTLSTQPMDPTHLQELLPLPVESVDRTAFFQSCLPQSHKRHTALHSITHTVCKHCTQTWATFSFSLSFFLFILILLASPLSLTLSLSISLPLSSTELLALY